MALLLVARCRIRLVWIDHRSRKLTRPHPAPLPAGEGTLIRPSLDSAKPVSFRAGPQDKKRNNPVRHPRPPPHRHAARDRPPPPSVSPVILALRRNGAIHDHTRSDKRRGAKRARRARSLASWGNSEQYNNSGLTPVSDVVAILPSRSQTIAILVVIVVDRLKGFVGICKWPFRALWL